MKFNFLSEKKIEKKNYLNLKFYTIFGENHLNKIK